MFSIKNSTFMNVNKTSNFFGNINKENSFAGKNNEQKVNKIKSELHHNLFWTFKILIMFFKLIGLATFAYRIVIYKKRTSYTFQCSKLGIVYNVVLTSLIIALYCMSIPYILNEYYHDKTNLTVGIEVLQSVLGALVSCVILISYCIKQKSLVRIANRLITIEHEIQRLYDLCYLLRRQRIFYTMIIVCILKICLLILLLFTDILVIQIVRFSWLTIGLLIFLVGWLLIQYFLLVTVIQTGFVDVNRAIQNLTRINTPDLRLQSLCQTRRIIVNNSTVHQLLQLRDVHCHLCEISEDVSSFYSLPVLFGIIFVFPTLIYSSYYLFSPLLMTNDILNLNYSYIFNLIVWMIFLIYPIFLLTNRITRILIEMKKTGLKKFSLQLLHRKVQFTANGYFRLDNTFFHSLIGTVTTYFVILVQFQIGSSRSLINANCTGSNVTIQG
ncbi:Putative gustatory receptor 28b [Trachymyrmex cornetzi]|uniref:Gustatory receptor n=1 Tax=Trachymyrmex cornetzi TaxID=471704 RepID=A0A195DA34_9HYME|nr:Putative gustatory receptor 28b [Trachymyrmex cornetzi]